MRILFFLFSVFICTQSYAKNLGHRLGNYAFPDLPENSIEIYRALLNDKKLLEKVEYIEFDVRELKTGELIVFHDSNLNSGVIQGFNNKVFKSSYDCVKCLCLKKSPKDSCYKIPMVEDILKESERLNKTKRVMIEIKHITEQGKNKLITLMNEYKKEVDMGIIIKKSRFDDMFSRKWCADFNNAGYSVMRTGEKKDPVVNNLCAK